MSEDGGTNQFIVCDSNQTNNVATDTMNVVWVFSFTSFTILFPDLKNL